MARMIRLVSFVAIAVLVAAACGGDDDSSESATTATTATTAPATVTTTTTVATTTPTTTLALPIQVEVTADLPYTSQQKLDVYAPIEGTEWPVVVYLHGSNPTSNADRRKDLEPQARAIAEQGVVVYAPTRNGNGPAGGSEESICALAFAHCHGSRLRPWSTLWWVTTRRCR